MIRSAGRILVPSPGTLVRASLNEVDPAKTYLIHGIMFQALASNSGNVYIGLRAMNAATLDDVLAVLPVPTANFLPSFSASLTIAPNGLNLADFYIDAAVAGNGVLVALLRT